MCECLGLGLLSRPAAEWGEKRRTRTGERMEQQQQLDERRWRKGKKRGGAREKTWERSVRRVAWTRLT